MLKISEYTPKRFQSQHFDSNVNRLYETFDYSKNRDANIKRNGSQSAKSSLHSSMYKTHNYKTQRVPEIVVVDLNAELKKVKPVELNDICHLKFKIKQAIRILGTSKFESMLFKDAGNP